MVSEKMSSPLASFLFVTCIYTVQARRREEEEVASPPPDESFWWGWSFLIPVLLTLVACVVGGILVLASRYGWKWHREGKKRFKEITEQASPFLMKRRKLPTDITLRSSQMMLGNTITLARELDLRPEYVIDMAMRDANCEVMSLGEYLSSLVPVGVTKGLTSDINHLLGAALLRTFGEKLGTALLPSLALLDKTISTAAGLGGFAAAAVAAGAEQGPSVAQAVIAAPSTAVRALGGMSPMVIAGATDAMAAAFAGRRVQKNPSAEKENGDDGDGGSQAAPPSALDIMRRGETYEETFPPELVPNPFVFSEHWTAAIKGMEDSFRQRGLAFDPDEHGGAAPKPVREALLPDLYTGSGHIRTRDTNRRILQNRLFAIILNRLGTNDVLEELQGGNKGAAVFSVKLDPNKDLISRPDDLVSALIMSSHKVKVYSAIRTTSFGLKLCVREDSDDGEAEDEQEGDGKMVSGTSQRFLNIPIGLCLRTGLQTKDGQPVPSFLTHSAVELVIQGPIIDDAIVQFYQADEGFTGWLNGQYTDAPWMWDFVGRTFDDPIRCVRLAALASICLNSVATRLGLPLGGYGLTGVCNDSAALIEQAVFGNTNIYPLLSIGAYFGHVIRRARELHQKLKDSKLGVPSHVVQDVADLPKAMLALPNDVHPNPVNTLDTARRILSCIPKNPHFVLMDTARTMLEDIVAEEREANKEEPALVG